MQRLLFCALLGIGTLLLSGACDQQQGDSPTGDRQIRYEFDVQEVDTDNPEGLILGEKIKFSLSNHAGVDSTVFVSRLKTTDGNVPAVVELRNATDDETITSMKTSSTEFVDVDKDGFVDDFPDKTITLTVVIRPQSDGASAVSRGAWLFLYRDL